MPQVAPPLAIRKGPHHFPSVERPCSSFWSFRYNRLLLLEPQGNGQFCLLRPSMRRLRIGILDLVTKSPNPSLYGRVMNANLASIMPQVLGVWCEQEGHDVRVVCYTGMENLLDVLPADLDMVFVGAFTQSAQLAYALSNFFRKRGAVTVLSGPHARCYPEDAKKYYDYVLGFTDKNTIAEVCRECSQHRPMGRHVMAATQPLELPTLEERWKFV